MPESGESPPAEAADGPLAGLRVLDLSQMLSGPLCAMRLGDLGADVIKVEPPGRGEWIRARALGNIEVCGETPSMVALNRNKRGVTIDLKNPAGLAVFHRLVGTADVVLQNFRVGVADRLGIGFDALREINPCLVYCSVSGYGEHGPYRERPGQDLVIQGYTGSMWLTGRKTDPPIANSLWSCDVMAGYQAAIGILAALRARERTGRGQRVDVNMLAVAMDCEVQELTTHLNGGPPPERTEEHIAHALLGAPYGAFPTADGWITLAHVPLPELGELLDDDWLRTLDDPHLGLPHRDAITRRVSAGLARRTTAEWLELLHERRLYAGPVYNYDELVGDPHVKATGMIVEVDMGERGSYRMPGVPIALSDTPASIRRPPPALGEHTDEVLREALDSDDNELERLRRSSAI